MNSNIDKTLGNISLRERERKVGMKRGREKARQTERNRETESKREAESKREVFRIEREAERESK